MTTISITDYYTFSGTGIVGATPIGGSNGSTVSRAQNFSIRDVRECVGALSGEGEKPWTAVAEARRVCLKCMMWLR